MNYRRYLVEFDTGVDLHGTDVTKAAKKAVKGAISHCCLCGITELLGLKNPAEAMKVSIKIASPFPEKVNRDEVCAEVPFGKTEIEVVQGGLTGCGLSVPVLGDGDTIVMVNAILAVWVNVEQVQLDF